MRYCRLLPGGEFEQLPDLPLCDDFATPTDITKQCADPDCCGDIKEEFTKVDEDTGEKSTVIVGRHGCESDVAHYIGNDAPLCADHTDSCFNMDHSTLPNHNVCICTTKWTSKLLMLMLMQYNLSSRTTT